jgi:ABC-2 type transport system ATP-binding protein
VIPVNILNLEGLTKKFDSVAVIDNITLNVREGEIFGLLGPNGAGKSTTINIICGLLRADRGQVELFGKDIRRNALYIKSNIGIVPQDIAIYESLTAYENVAFFASLYGLRGKDLETRALEALEFTGLSDSAKEYPSKFSGGMKRRLNIACSIAHKPKLIIMDEPTVGIDPQSRNHILESVKRLNAQGCTVIYTSHYMEEVVKICSRIAIMDHGKIIAEGTKEELESLITDEGSLIFTVGGMEKLDADQLKAIPGVHTVHIDEDSLTVNSDKSVNNLDKVIHTLSEKGVVIRSLENRKPDLETVFLALTGRKLRD